MDCNGDSFAGTVDDDLNGDGKLGDILDCEIAGVLSLNDSFVGLMGVDVGLVAFGELGATADVQAITGQQDFTYPEVGDIEVVAASLDNACSSYYGTCSSGSGYYGVGEYTYYYSGPSTYFYEAIDEFNNAFAAEPAHETNVVYFLTDGKGTLKNDRTYLDAAVAAGTTIHTFTVGANAQRCGEYGTTWEMSDATGGSCTDVTDPTELSSALVGVTPAGIDSVELRVNGGAWIGGVIDGIGNWDGVLPGDQILVGINLIEVSVIATDGTVVTADIEVIGQDPNDPPVALCADPTFEADTDCAVEIDAMDVDGGSYDPNDDPITYDLSDYGPFGVGTHAVTLTVTDDLGEMATCEAIVTVTNAAPVALCADLTLPADEFCMADGEIDGGSFDPEGYPLVSYTTAPLGPYGVGDTLVSLTVEDVCGATATCDAYVTVENAAPVVACEDLVLEAGDDCTAEGELIYYTEDVQDVDVEIDEQGPFDHGDTTVTYTVTDACGATSVCQATVTVIDTTEPTVTVGGGGEMWPPNHKYWDWTLADCGVTIEDNCDTLDVAADGYLDYIYSDEEEDASGKGDGKTSLDIVILNDLDFDLRAEREGSDNGRVYGIAFTVEDESGNPAEAMCYVEVPHSQNGDVAIDDGPNYIVYP